MNIKILRYRFLSLFTFGKRKKHYNDKINKLKYGRISKINFVNGYWYFIVDRDGNDVTVLTAKDKKKIPQLPPDGHVYMNIDRALKLYPNTNKFALVFYMGIGDYFWITPFIKMLKKKYPQIDFEAWVGSENDGNNAVAVGKIMANNPYISDVKYYNGSSGRFWKNYDYSDVYTKVDDNTLVLPMIYLHSKDVDSRMAGICQTFCMTMPQRYMKPIIYPDHHLTEKSRELLSNVRSIYNRNKSKGVIFLQMSARSSCYTYPYTDDLIKALIYNNFIVVTVEETDFRDNALNLIDISKTDFNQTLAIIKRLKKYNLSMITVTSCFWSISAALDIPNCGIYHFYDDCIKTVWLPNTCVLTHVKYLTLPRNKMLIAKTSDYDLLENDRYSHHVDFVLDCFDKMMRRKHRWHLKHYISKESLSDLKSVSNLNILKRYVRDTTLKEIDNLRSLAENRISLIENKTKDLFEQSKMKCPELNEIISTALCEKQQGNIFIDQTVSTKLHKQMADFFYPDFDQNKIIEGLRLRFEYNYDKYLQNRASSDPVRRLFITSGTLSVINALCYIRETENEGNFSDTMLLYGNFFPNFIKNIERFVTYGDFERILFCKHNNNIENVLLSNNVTNVDEVVFIYNDEPKPVIQRLYKKAKLTVIFEAVPLMQPAKDKWDQPISCIYTRAVMDKIDYPHPECGIPVRYMEKKTLLKLTRQIQEDLDLQIVPPYAGKWILFLCPDAWVQERLPVGYSEKLIKKLQRKGYDVMIKRHPRTPDHAYFTLGLESISTSYPVEFYDMSRLVGVFSYRTNALLFLQDLDVPTFCIDTVETESILSNDALYYVAKHYSLPVKALLQENAKEKTAAKLREKFRKMQKTLWEEASKLSEDSEYTSVF